jgi:carbamoyltransferase
MSLNVVGISAHFHDSACCVLRDGELVAAAQEERFTRKKHDPSLPRFAFRYCLQEAGLTMPQIDCVAYYEDPQKKLARQLWMASPILLKDETMLFRLDSTRPQRELRKVLGYEGPVEIVDHHHSHGASSFYYSGFPEAAILTVDGVGEWATTTYGRGAGDDVTIFEEVHFPDSLGLLYSTITSYIGFSVNSGEYKVMGLAPYGQPRYVDQLHALIQSGPRGQYQLELKYFDFLRRDRMYSDEMLELFGQPARVAESEILQFHKDLARSLQVVLEEVLLEKAAYLYEHVPSENLCMAGGVALNCVANGQLLRKGPFKRLFVQPAANDAGSALGAAAIAHRRLTGSRIPLKPLAHAYLGPRYSSDEIGDLLKGVAANAIDFRGKEDELLAATAGHLASGKVVGWFHGRMEFGPRALGARSILADPRDPSMRDRINALVKKREAFRPFAPVVLEWKTAEHFQLDHPSPFMLETCRVVSRLDLPAVTHVDQSARVQTVCRETNPRFARLLEEFDRQTGCPILLNTSFNMRGEPIVCTPLDAFLCFLRSAIDALVLEDFLIMRSEVSPACAKLLAHYETASESGVSRSVYTLF